jgi:hypothetical protein
MMVRVSVPWEGQTRRWLIIASLPAGWNAKLVGSIHGYGLDNEPILMEIL